MRPARGSSGRCSTCRSRSFVTTRVVKVLYVLTIVLLLIAYAGIAIAIFSGGEEVATVDDNGQITTTDGGGNVGLGIFWLVVLGPLMLFLYTLLYRVFYELIIVVFRIYENTRDQLELTRRSLEVRGAEPAAAAGAASVALTDEGGDGGQRPPGASRWGECRHARCTRSTDRPPTLDASSWAIVPYWSCSPWMTSSGDVMSARYSSRSTARSPGPARHRSSRRTPRRGPYGGAPSAPGGPLVS